MIHAVECFFILIHTVFKLWLALFNVEFKLPAFITLYYPNCLLLVVNCIFFKLI